MAHKQKARRHLLSGQAAQLERQKTAAEAKAERAAFTPREQIAALDARLGLDVGAKKERKRLKREIDHARQTAKKETQSKGTK